MAGLLTRVVFAGFMAATLAAGAMGQNKRPAAKASKKAPPLIFAVLNDGKTLEPIAAVMNGKLEVPTPGDDEAASLKSFSVDYYRPGTAYDLIFGGARAGRVTVKSNNPASDCGKNLAEITLSAPDAKINGMVMALATNLPLKADRERVRRSPSAAERAAVEKLVRDRFRKEGVSSAALKTLRYQNLTAIDADRDGRMELIGSYWTAPNAKERDVFSFIANGGGDKYSFGYSEFSRLTPDKIMSGDVKDLDGGIGHELYLDEIDVDGDGTDEIFMIGQAFEGNNFLVYKKQKSGTWARIFEAYNYHCAY
jgi:hypothetical protein